jgi:hypothetical protein
LGPDAKAVADELCNGLREAEFTIPRHVLADIDSGANDAPQSDGSITLTIEALTIQE